MTDLYVNVYNVSNVMGGPEEGGWNFEHGIPVTSIQVNRDEAHRRTWFRHTDISGPDYEVMAEYGYRGFPEGRCPEYPIGRDFGEDMTAIMREMARDLIEDMGLRDQFPDTGRRGSVLGGDDFTIRIESHFAREYPTEVPRWE